MVVVKVYGKGKLGWGKERMGKLCVDRVKGRQRCLIGALMARGEGAGQQGCTRQGKLDACCIPPNGGMAPCG